MVLTMKSSWPVLETASKRFSVILTKSFFAFIQRCSARGVKLAVEKRQLCLEEVPLIGHYAVKPGLKIHPEKVRAVLEMPRPTDVKSLLRFNGTV